MSKNYEIKVRVDNLPELMSIVRSKKQYFIAREHQTDYYYKANSGRLKLRVIDSEYGVLIHYLRSDKSGAKVSNYEMASTSEFRELHRILKSQFKVLATVEKERTIFVKKNIRIHFDNVKKLGTFVEIEIIFDNLSKARIEMKKLISMMKLKKNMFVKKSYSDLLLKLKK